MSGPMYSVKLPYRVYCSLPECGKPVFHVFRKELDGIMCNFCSPYHCRTGEERWEEKKRLDVRMGVPVKEEEPEMISGNTDELIDE